LPLRRNDVRQPSIFLGDAFPTALIVSALGHVGQSLGFLGLYQLDHLVHVLPPQGQATCTLAVCVVPHIDL
jgi:hypothetical protein